MTVSRISPDATRRNASSIIPVASTAVGIRGTMPSWMKVTKIGIAKPIDAIASENTKSGSPLNGKLAGRYGTSGYSMGGGGTTLASVSEPTLRSSLGLAPWEPTGENVDGGGREDASC